MAVGIGNGAAVYVPKEYSGREVIVLLPEGVEGIRKRVFEGISGFLDNIVGVYIFGSYARQEEERNSDVDILIITKEKDVRIKNAIGDGDIRVMTLDSVKRAIREQPLLIVPILREAKTIINPVLLEELKAIEIDFKKFKWNFDDIRRIIKIIEGFIKLDDEDISISHVYSLILRIRVCYLIECLLKNKKFSNEGTKELLLTHGFGRKEIDNYFDVYRRVRDDEEPKDKIKKEDILKIINFLKIYSEKVENETKKKIGKRH